MKTSSTSTHEDPGADPQGRRWLRWILSWTPRPCGRWEWALMRLFLAVLVFHSLQTARPFTYPDQPRPNGIARVVDLSFLAKPGPVDLSALPDLELPLLGALRFHGPGWFDTVVVAVVVLGLLYAWGRALPLVIPLLALTHTLPWTYANSQGFIHHGHQLVSLVLWTQAAVSWWYWIRFERRRGGADPPDGSDGAKPLPLRSYLLYYSQGVVALAYFTCALTKLLASKGLWLVQSHHIAIEVVVAQRREFYKRLEHEDGFQMTAAQWLLEHPWAALLLFNAGFLLELVAPLALRARVFALVIGLLLVLFHRSVWVLMRLTFEMHEWLVIILFLNLPFWIWLLARKAAGAGAGRLGRGARVGS